MVVGFGIGVGDCLAVSRLIICIGAELKRNPESAAQYQDLLIELEALDRALTQLLSIGPANHEVNCLEAVRALALTCQGPLEEFLKRIEKFESSLGSWNIKSNGFRGFHRRIQWSLMYKDDVELLRARLAPKISTITILLLTQNRASLAKAESDRHGIAREVARKLFGQDILLKNMTTATASVLDAQATLAIEQAQLRRELEAQDQNISTVASKADEMLKQAAAAEQHLNQQDAFLTDLKAQVLTSGSQIASTYDTTLATQQDVSEIKTTTSSILGLAISILNIATTGISKFNKIADLIYRVMKLTTEFTMEMRRDVAALLRGFWEMERQLTLIQRYLPGRIYLPVVGFRDAFNELRSLPYDLARNWQKFQGLVAVIFMDQQGLHRVNRGLYFITHARIGDRIRPAFWTNAIEPGDELSMTMIINDVEAEEGFCPYPNCRAPTANAELIRGGRFCPVCHKFAALSQPRELDSLPKQSDQVEDMIPNRPSVGSLPPTRRIRGNSNTNEDSMPDVSPIFAPELDPAVPENISLYHFIEVVLSLRETSENDSLHEVSNDDDSCGDSVFTDDLINETIPGLTRGKNEDDENSTIYHDGTPPKYTPYGDWTSPYGSGEYVYYAPQYDATPTRHSRKFSSTQTTSKPGGWHSPAGYRSSEYYESLRSNPKRRRAKQSPIYAYDEKSDTDAPAYRQSRRPKSILKTPQFGYFSYQDIDDMPRRSSARKTTGPKIVPAKATIEDARKAGIPQGYSIKNWDPAEEPIVLLGSVFDANSLGKWIYDWTVYHHGSSSLMADLAGDLWLLLIKLGGKIKRAEDCLTRIRSLENKGMVEDFIESGDRIWEKFKVLLKECERYIFRAAKRESRSDSEREETSLKKGNIAEPLMAEKREEVQQNSGQRKDLKGLDAAREATEKDTKEPIQKETQEATLEVTEEVNQEVSQQTTKETTQEATRRQITSVAGTEFIDSIFGRDRLLEQTEKMMNSIRLWNMRFDANCDDILRRPSAA